MKSNALLLPLQSVFPLKNRLTALLEPSQALEYLAYLGFTYQTGVCPPPDADYLPLGVTPSFGFGSSATNSDLPQPNLCGCLGNSADSLLRGLVITSERRMDYIRGHTNRTVFYCRVYGSRKVGKVCQIRFFTLHYYPCALKLRKGGWGC